MGLEFEDKDEELKYKDLAVYKAKENLFDKLEEDMRIEVDWLSKLPQHEENRGIYGTHAAYKPHRYAGITLTAPEQLKKAEDRIEMLERENKRLEEELAQCRRDLLKRDSHSDSKQGGDLSKQLLPSVPKRLPTKKTSGSPKGSPKRVDTE